MADRSTLASRCVGSFRPSELELVAEAEDDSVVGRRAATIHYTHNGITTFEAPVETIFAYMRDGDHPHQAFKTHRVVSVDGNLVTVAVEGNNPDGSTTEMAVQHRLHRRPGWLELDGSYGSVSPARGIILARAGLKRALG